MRLLIALMFFLSVSVDGKEIALTFDDAPYDDSAHFKSAERTNLLIRKLEKLNTGPVMVFAVPCRFEKERSIASLKLWRNSGHYIANHSCSHPDLDKMTAQLYIENLEKADQLLKAFFPSDIKFFRYPYLHEGDTSEKRDKVREWLTKNGYRNGYVSIDNDEWLFHHKLNQAKRAGKKIDYEQVGNLYVRHIVSALDYYDGLAVDMLGRRPKHVLLLHEIDSSVLFIEPLVDALKEKGWKIIDPTHAYSDPIYDEVPNNLYSNNGLIAQIAEERGVGHFAFRDSLRDDLNKTLGLEKE